MSAEFSEPLNPVSPEAKSSPHVTFLLMSSFTFIAIAYLYSQRFTKDVNLSQLRLEDYDVTFSLSLVPLYISLKAKSKDILQRYLSPYSTKTLVIFGDYNIGKTFLLGRLFRKKFQAESLVEHTQGLSLSRFQIKEGFWITLVDTEGSNAPIDSTSENSIRHRFSQENLIGEICFHVGDFLFLMMDRCSAENSQKILAFRRRALEAKKDLILIFNWKTAQTYKEIEELERNELGKTFGKLCYPTPDGWFVDEDASKGLARVNIFTLGNDFTPQTRLHNDEVLRALVNLLSVAENYKIASPVQRICELLSIKPQNFAQESPIKPEYPEILSNFYESFPSNRLVQETYPEDAQERLQEGLKDFPVFLVISEATSENNEVEGEQNPPEREEFKLKVGSHFSGTRLLFDLTGIQVKEHYYISRGRECGSCFAFNFPGQRLVDSQTKPEDMDTNTFKLKLLNSGFGFEIISVAECENSRVGGSPRHGAKGMKTTERFTQRFQQLEKKIFTADYVLGKLFVWCVEVDQEGKESPDAVEFIQGKRKEVLAGKLNCSSLEFSPKDGFLNVY